MRKPKNLVALLEELEPSDDHTLALNNDSHMSISSERGVLDINREDCERLLIDEDIVDKFFKAIGSPDDAVCELFDLDVSNAVFDKLEEVFNSVEVY